MVVRVRVGGGSLLQPIIAFPWPFSELMSLDCALLGVSPPTGGADWL